MKIAVLHGDNLQPKLGELAKAGTVEMFSGAPLPPFCVSVNAYLGAPGNDASIGGVKVVSDDGWFAVRPSGTEAICKVYTESFKGEDHLQAVQKDAIDFLEQLLKSKD